MKPLVIAGAVLLLAALGIGAFFLLRPDSPEPQDQGTMFPGGTNGGAGAGGGLTLPTEGEASVTVKDFLNNGTTEEDVANPGNYYLAGESGYCSLEGDCVEGAPSENFNIVYFSEDQSFVVALTGEPLSTARFDAEAFLMNALGISEDAMCALRTYVGTDSYTNPHFGGQDLKFSFCPGAVNLP